MTLTDELEQTRDETLPYFDLPDEDLSRCYAPGKWDVRFLLHHLSDAETVLFYRIRRVLSEPNQVIWAFDQDAWASGLDYARRSLALSRELYTATREGILYYASEYLESRGAIEFVHSETGLRTLSDEFRKVAMHNRHHLAQIERALRQVGGTV